MMRALIDDTFELDRLRKEVDSLRAEVDHLHRRDSTVNYMMQKIDEELRLAARLQRDFMPRNPPRVNQLSFSTLFRPAGYVSGDLYDIMRLDEQHVGFYLLDAVGHGMPAALLTMFIKQALVTKEIRDKSYRLLTPGETLANLNQQLVEQELTHATFATAIYGIINSVTGKLQFATAGHPSPIRMSADGSLEHLIGDGGLLGIFENEQFADVTVQLHPGDRLILYTDGVEVAFEHHDQLQPQRWLNELTSFSNHPSQEMLLKFSHVVDQQDGSAHPKDDLTLLVADFAAPSPS
jgi:sigma-B regulation protein RsbU (phosphoserine phosphatase)